MHFAHSKGRIAVALLTGVLWHHLLTQFLLTCPLLSSIIAQQSSPGSLSYLQPFNQFQWYPGPGPYLTWGASPALLGPTHGPWSSMGKQMRCHQHKVSVQPLVLLVSTSTLTFSAREPQQSCKQHKVRHLLLPQGYSLSNITNPVPTCIKEDMNIQESLKDKCCLISYSLLNSEMIFMSHKWDIYFISQVIGGNNISRTHFT